MKSNFSKGLLMTALITGSVIWGGTNVFAEELQEYTLDPMVITAQRMETKDLQTPAAVEVVTKEKIENSGAGSAYDVLQNALGVMSSAQGPNGAAMGSMTSKIIIRGVDKGTLVMVDGVPMNQDGKYNLEDIPSDMIEKIEIVRGGGSVLYGSEATGGVVNIITKNTVKNSVKVSAGNYGRERYAVSVGADRFNATASLENRGKISNMTTTVKNTAMGKTSYRHYDYIKGESKGILWNYNINDNVKFTHNYVENNNVMDVIDNTYLKSPYQRKEYDDHNNTFALAIDDKHGFTSNLSYGTQERNYDQITWKKDGTISKAIKYSWRKGYNTNLNVQKVFDVNEKDKFLLGASFKREELDVYGSAAKKMGNTPAKPERTGAYNRDIYSLYASYDWQMTDADKLIVNLRETFVRNAKGDNTDLSTGITTKTVQMNQSKFTPEIQYIRDLTDNSSFYAKAGKSYRLPELTKIFGGSVILPSVDLKPEHGVHYEMGYKLNEANRSWRLAVFNYDVKDAIESISGTAAEGNLIYSNTDVKNTGVELSLNVKHNDNLDSFWGVTYSNPKQKSFKTSSSAGGEWIKYNNQFQFNMGINYHADKFASALSANYIGMRTDGTSAVHDRMKPALYTDLHFSYAPEKNQKAFLHINNLLDRKDYTTSKGPDETTYGYYTTGINFMVGYEYSF